LPKFHRNKYGLLGIRHWPTTGCGCLICCDQASTRPKRKRRGGRRRNRRERSSGNP
jgi:hypothetical protein